MTDDFFLQFSCSGCDTDVAFPIKAHQHSYLCPTCQKEFQLNETLSRQLQLFIALCQQLKASEEVLSNACVAVTVGSTEVKLPFKLLLTRCRTTFEFSVDEKKIVVSSRAQPYTIANSLTDTTTT